MKFFFRSVAVCLGLAALLPADVKAEAVTILILPFDNASKSKELDDLQTQFPDILTAYLTPFSDRLTVLDRSNLARMAAEGALYIEGKLSPAIETKVPQWSQARYILEGSFILIGGSFHLTASLYETETTRLRKTFEVSGEKNHLSRAGEVLATQMAGFFSAEVKPLKDLPTDEDPETTLFFIRGLGFFIHGQFPRAYPEFMKILRQHPDHALARYWLARSFDQGGLKDQARIEYETFLRQYPRHPKAVEVSTALKEIR